MIWYRELLRAIAVDLGRLADRPSLSKNDADALRRRVRRIDQRIRERPLEPSLLG